MRAAAVILAAALTGCAAPLITAARDGDVAKIDALLASGADVNAHDPHSWPCDTPLFQAAYNGRNEAIRDLLKHGADLGPESVAYKVANALACAEIGHQATTVKLLLAAGAKTDPNIMEAARTPMFGVSGTIRDMLERADAAQNASAAPPRIAAAATLPAPAADIDADSPLPRAAERPDDFALVIGIEKYSRLPDARFAERDADSIKRRLLALGYPERNIILLKGGQATRGAVQGYVEEWLPKNAKPESQVLVYFSGHGSPDPKNGDAYLVPWDGDAMFLKSTAYPLKTLYASLGRLKAKHVVVALDSCFSGAGGRSVLADGARPLVSHVDSTDAPAGVTVLSAASGDEITGTIDAQRHGAFTYYLLKSIDGKRTVRGAYDQLKPRVQDEAHRQNREQTPLMLGDDTSF